MSDHPTRTIPTDESAATPPTGDSTGIDPNSPASPATAPIPPPGYEFAGEIGRGGMGAVYRARDTRLSRDVAVKVLQGKYAPGSPAARRFVEEARITGQLQHPGIPPIHEVGTLADGRPFLVMKLIKGRTLADQLADGPAERGALIAVFEQVCQAVAYAHNHSVIHRDLKPANVMVGAFGEVQVMDWGLAKFRTDARVETAEATTLHDPRGEWDTDVRTRTGSFLGTPAYMSPEQAIGAVDQIDERSDVFGLGGILCAILTGQPPFVAATPEAIRQLAAQRKLDAAFARLDACGAEPGLLALCKRCLAAERDDRPRNSGEVADAVHRLRADAEDRARQAELDRVRAEGERAKAEAETREQRKRRRAQLALATAVGLLLAGGGAVAWWQDRQATQRRVEAENRDRGERARLARNGDALADLVGQCEQALRADDPDRAAAALEQIDRRLAEGGGDAVRDRADRCRADLTMLRELDAIDTFWWTRIEGKFPDRKDRAARWRAAFTGYGLAPGESPADEAAGRLAGSLVRDRLLTALDLWLVAEPSVGVREVLRAADQDPYRDAVRDAIASRNSKRVAELAGQPQALALPPGFAAALGQYGGVAAERRRVVLRAALRARSGELTLLMELGGSYPIKRREGADERVRWYQAAVAAHPRCTAAHQNLGLALWDKGDANGAVDSFREAVRLDPRSAFAHNDLGVALRTKGDVDGAIASYREAIRLDPKYANAHSNLGATLAHVKRDYDGAIASLREAIRLDPTNAPAHNNLGNVLRTKGNLDGAIAAYKEAVRLKIDFRSTYMTLAVVLNQRGEPRAALDVLQGSAHVNPGWFADPATGFRYNSVCLACLAAAGQAKDAPTPAERPALRKQALDWLAADLTAWRKRLTADPKKDRVVVHRTMAQWLTDADLASVREQARLEKLPIDERVGWVKLWAEVRELRDATAPPEVAPPPRRVAR